MADLESAGEEELRRASPDESGKAVQDAENVHPAKKLRQEDGGAIHAAEESDEAIEAAHPEEEDKAAAQKEVDGSKENYGGDGDGGDDDDGGGDDGGDGGHGHEDGIAHDHGVNGDGVKPEPTRKGSKEATLGPRRFTSSKDMFYYFFDLLRGWPLNVNINKYEHMMLEDLLKKGHQESKKKIGAGIEAFQVRVNPEFDSRCYYIIRKDGSIEDFSYRKCVNNIIALPSNMKPNFSTANLKRKGEGGFKGQHNNEGKGGRFSGRRGGGGRSNRGRGGHRF